VFGEGVSEEVGVALNQSDVLVSFKELSLGSDVEKFDVGQCVCGRK
jgi:hypothetical protein